MRLLRSTILVLAAVSVLQAQESDRRLNSQGSGWKLYTAEASEPGLPRVLLIGDSILNGYRAEVARLLKGKANVDAWVNPYHQASAGLHRMIREVLAQGPYAAVHFNIGLHGWQKGRIPEGQFETLMRAYIRAIADNSAGARLVWASSTPVTVKGQPLQLDPEINTTIVEHNRLAAMVARELKVPVNDLYSLAAARLELARGDQFHWNAEAYKLMAAAVVKSIDVSGESMPGRSPR